MTPEQLHILQHALGVDRFGRGPQYRNHYCAGGAAEVTCRELVALGLMRQHPTTAAFPDANFSVTDAGRAAMRQASPEPPTLTRSQRRYREFLDADSNLKFGEWLKERARRGRRDEATEEAIA